MIRRVLSWHRARKARLHEPLPMEPDFKAEVRALMEQQAADIRALGTRVRLLEHQHASDDDILSREFAGLDKAITTSAKQMIPDEEDRP